MRYTKKIHVYRLEQMLNKNNPCFCCPASKKFDSNSEPDDIWDNDKFEICKICNEFVGIRMSPFCHLSRIPVLVLN